MTEYEHKICGNPAIFETANKPCITQESIDSWKGGSFVQFCMETLDNLFGPRDRGLTSGELLLKRKWGE